MIYNIQANCSSNRKYEVNELEESFFNSLSSALKDYDRIPRLTRMSNGTISVYYGGCPVGKIKLQGRNHWMQILKGLSTVRVVEGELDDFIGHIPEWVNYIRLHCK